MDFSLDEAQRAVAGLAASVLRGDADVARAVAALATDSGFDETLWKAMGQSGLLALAIPAELKGDGFGAVETALVLSEVGRQIQPLPALATLACGVLPVVRFATAEQQRALLAEVADGRVLTAALRDASGTSVRWSGTTVTGRRVGVPYAALAHRILVPTAAGTAVIDPNAPGVSLQRSTTSTGAPEYTMVLDGAQIEAVLDARPDDLDRYAVAGAAAVADGVLAAALALTAEQVRSRHQFGRPLATFQAVAQQVADLYVIARTIHLIASSVAWRLDAGLDAEEDVAIAAYWLAAELPRALQTCHHLHGGLGVDISYPLHRYYSQAKDLARLVGGASHRLDRLGDRCASN